MAEEGQVIGCHSVEQWNQHLQKGQTVNKLIVVDFTASWCAPCRFIAPFFSELAKKFTNVIFLKVDVDELKTIATEYSVEAMPSFMFLKDGKVVDKVIGAKKELLQQIVEKYVATSSA